MIKLPKVLPLFKIDEGEHFATNYVAAHTIPAALEALKEILPNTVVHSVQMVGKVYIHDDSYQQP